MDAVALFAARERADLFNEAGARRGLAAGILEKDFWVCWTLKRLFTLPGGHPSLVFKGGTSLSKVYRAIKRFSEDIDLSFDRRDLGYVDDRDPQNASTRKKERLVEDLIATVMQHIETVLLPSLTEVVGRALVDVEGGWGLAKATDDSQTLIFRYPPSFAEKTYGDLDYVNPVVRLEFGARGEPWPIERHSITPYAAEEFPNLFGVPGCDVTVLAAERTFWEKATLLHSEYHRAGASKERLSRHYYDLALLADTEAGRRAVRDVALLETVARHKDTFFRAAWSHYETARPGTLRLVPPPERRSELVEDYGRMVPMFFEAAQDFRTILTRLDALEREINESR